MLFVIDTNIYIELDRKNESIIQELSKIRGEAFITSPSYSEIYYGILKDKNIESKLVKLNSINLLNTTKVSARLFSEIKLSLEKKRDLIPLFDILIASIVMANNMTLITTDRHFKEIPSLKTIILNQ